jgi:hypothetical protein
MALNSLKTDLARYIIDSKSDQDIDLISFGEEDSPWLAVVFVDETAIVFYTNATDHAEAWQGDPREIVDKGHELCRKQLIYYKNEHCDSAVEQDIQYNSSNKSVFEDMALLNHYISSG